MTRKSRLQTIIFFHLIFFFSLNMLQAQKIRLAILPFDNTGGNEEYGWLSLGVPESLAMKLSDLHNLQLVERLKLDELMDEYRFMLSGIADEETVIDPDSLAGAEILMLGSYQTQGDSILINIRFLDVETGTVKEGSGVAVEGSLDSIFSLYNLIGAKIVHNLNISMTPAEESLLADPLELTESLESYRHFVLGMKEFRTGSEEGYMAAYDSFLSSLKADPEFGLAHAYTALSLEEISMLRAVSGREYREYSNLVPDYYNRAVEFGEEGPEIYKALARVLHMRGDRIQALRQIANSIYLNPMDWESWLIWWRIKDGKDPEHPYLMRAREIAPDSAEVQLAVGEAMMSSSRVAEALYFYTRAWDLDPDNLQVLHRLAELYEYRGYYQQAIANYEALIEKSPGETGAVIELARLYYQTNQPEKCISLSEEFLVTEPGTIPVRFHLFLSRFILSDFDGAERELEEIMAEGSTSGFFYSPIDELRYLEEDAELGRRAKDMRQRLNSIREELGRKERESRQ